MFNMASDRTVLTYKRIKANNTIQHRFKKRVRNEAFVSMNQIKEEVKHFQSIPTPSMTHALVHYISVSNIKCYLTVSSWAMHTLWSLHLQNQELKPGSSLWWLLLLLFEDPKSSSTIVIPGTGPLPACLQVPWFPQLIPEGWHHSKLALPEEEAEVSIGEYPCKSLLPSEVWGWPAWE